MGRLNQSLPALALAVLAALAVASCGGSDAQLLPGETARDINTNLTAVRQLADEGDCLGAESAAQQVSEQVEALTGIDAKLKRALEQGAARLNEVVASCEESEQEETTSTTVTTEAENGEGKGTKKGAKQGEKEEREGGREEGGEEAEPPPPPQTEGETEGAGGGNERGGGEQGSEESSSGGVGPGTPVEGEGE
jgi:hypothetical protein